MACQYCSGGRYVPLNTCGYLCGGGVVSTAARQQSSVCHGVQTCPANTRLRGSSTVPAAQVNAGVGMVYAVSQQMENVYDAESALRTGTLFPSLHKPMNGRCPGSCNSSTEDQQTAFAAWDLRLYLDTHPEDAEALALFRQLCREAGDDSYATAFLPGGCADWNWTDDPWPWEVRPCTSQGRA